MKSVVYVGRANTRRFSADDAVGADLVFERNIPQEVNNEVAKKLVALGKEFVIEGESDDAVDASADASDAHDDAQESIPGL